MLEAAKLWIELRPFKVQESFNYVYNNAMEGNDNAMPLQNTE